MKIKMGLNDSCPNYTPYVLVKHLRDFMTDRAKSIPRISGNNYGPEIIKERQKL